MKLHELSADDDAVSPVIGVILMVAITVILAAVIGTFVLGLSDQVQNTSPNAQFTFNEDSNGNLSMTHNSGESIDVGNLNVTSDGATTVTACQDASGSNGWSADNGTISAGSTCTVPDGQLDDDSTVSITWQSDDGTTSATLADYEYN